LTAAAEALYARSPDKVRRIRSWIYLLRLAAFLLILFAIWRKNRSFGSD